MQSSCLLCTSSSMCVCVEHCRMFVLVLTEGRQAWGEGAAICAGALPDMGLAANFTVLAQSVQTGSLAVPLLQLCCIAD